MIIYPLLSFKKNTSGSELFWDGALQRHSEPSVVSFFVVLVTRYLCTFVHVCLE